jgi:ELWxxDGT repeat protein
VAGTVLVKDIVPGAEGSSPEHFTLAGKRLLFTARDRQHGHELWQSDGTPEGTLMLKDLRSGAAGAYPRQFTSVADAVFFIADDEAGTPRLWTITAAGTIAAIRSTAP